MEKNEMPYSQKQIQNFLRYLLDKGVSASSLKYYKSDISSFLSWAGNRKVETKLIREYINSERLITPVATLNRRLSTLRSYSNFVGHDFMSGIENVTTFRKIAKSWQTALINKLEARPKLKNLFSKVLFNRPNWYRKYHSYALANYVHIAILILFSSLSGYAVYDQVFYSTDRSLAFPSALERPNRFLSFQGRLTDNLGNPETVATDIVFNLYSVSSGGSTLWNSGTCSITPDQDGIFSTLLGSSCGSEIASSVFSENADIWLGVTVEADAEATPRIQIATVAYALNSETLQGFPAGTGTSTIPYIDSTGKLAIAAASPTIESTSGTFGVTGQAMTISTANTTNGNIGINPDGTGTLNLTFEGAAAGGGANGFVNAVNANITSGALYGGTVASAATGYNFIDFQSGVSPTSVFSVQNDGDIISSGDITIGGGNINTGNIALTIGDATTDSITLQTDGTGNGEVVLPNDSIGPNELLTTGQTDEYCLTYEASGTTMEWQLCGGGGGAWNDLTDPDGNLTLNHTTYTTAFNWDTGTGANDLFTLTTDNSSNGTGTLLNIQTGTSSTVNPFRVRSGSLEAIYVDTLARVGVGTNAPISRLSVINNPGAGNYTGKAAFLVDQYESEDILTASASGVTKLTLQNDGTLKLYNSSSTISNDSGDIVLDSAGSDFDFSADNIINLATLNATTGIFSGVIQAGHTSATTYSRLGSATTSHVGNLTTANDMLLQDLEVDGTLFLDGGTIANSAGTSFISFSGNNLYLNSSNDITILEDPTIQLSATNPTISASTTNSTLSLAANGVGTLTLQNGATGNIQFFSSSNTLSSSGTLTLSGDVAVNGDDITSDGDLDISATGYVRIGDSGTPNLANGDDDLYVEGDIELDGNLYIGTGSLYDDNVTSGIQLGAVNETALAGFGATSIVGALNELKSSSKNTGRNDYLSWANHYQSKGEGTLNDPNEKLNGLFFDTFQDGTKFDGVNSTSSGALRISDNSYRVGIMGGQTYNTATNDNDGQAYLGSNTVNDIYYYDRSKDSTPEVLVELGIDPNWYNGVTLSVATGSAQYSQAGTLADKNPNLTTSYNGSLIKATGTDSTPRTIFITIKSPTTFDWTNYQGDSATGVTITPGTAQTLGSTGVSATFTATNYNVGDVFKIASWYIEAEGTTRGAKQQFPERANMIAHSDGADIIDADTQKLWMNFDQASGYALFNTTYDPSSIKMLNGKMYVGEGASAALAVVDFKSDQIGYYDTSGLALSIRGVSQRNSNVGASTVNTTTSIVNNSVNDVDAAVIPNHPTKEVTVSGWGYVQETSASLDQGETVTFPYKFNAEPTTLATFAGYTTTAPTKISDCANGNSFQAQAMNRQITTTQFLVNIEAASGTWTNLYVCYTWTATGTVSPKQFVGVSTANGATIIDETNGTAVDYTRSGDTALSREIQLVDSATAKVYIHEELASSGNNVIHVYNSIPTADIQLNSATDRIAYSTWGTIGNSPVGTAATDDMNTFYVTKGTSTVNPNSDTLYVGLATGVTVIQQNNTSGNGNDNLNGAWYGSSSKHYTKDYVSEEMVGDIRGMWPFNTASASLIDISYKGNYLEDENAPTYSVSAIRGTGLTFDGTADHLCSDSDNNGACDVDTDYSFTTGSFSISTWFKHGSVTGTDTIIDRTYTTTPAAGDGFRITMNSSGNIVFGIDDDATGFPSDSVTSSGVYTDDLWHHIVAVKNGTVSISLYIDGQLVGTDSSITANSISDSSTILGVGSDCSVGAACATGANFWDGELDELTITANTVTDSQVRNMYQVGYRALQSHGTGLSSGTADGNQALAGASNNIGVVAPDWNNQYMYVGTNHTTDGALTQIQLNSDTAIKNYDAGDNDPDGGTQIIDDDVTSLGVGYQLEAVGSAASGVKSMAPDNNANALTGSLFSKTQTLNSATKFAYLWTSVYTDGSDSASAINVYACNNYATKALCDSNSAWVLGTTIQTDTTLTPAEREYNFSFPNAGAYLTFKVDFKRTDNKSNTYIERYGSTWSSSVGGADLAERYKSEEPVYPGDILSITASPVDGEAMVNLSKTEYDKKVIGIVTTNPGIVMDDNLVDLNWNAASRNSPDRPAVALSGRVPLKVSTKNGSIEVGDPITSSDIPGVGVKSTKAGYIVAKALESFTCDPITNEDGTETTPEVCEGKVLAFVNVSWFDPDAYLTDSGDLRIKGYEQIAEDGSTIKTIYKIVRVAVNGAEEIIDKIGVFKSVSTQDLATNIISPIADSDLIIDLDPNNSTDSAKLAIKGVNDEEVASIDSAGNASFSGLVIGDRLQITQDATISGTLYADDIESQRLEDIEDLLHEVESNQSLLAESQNWSTNTATESADLTTYTDPYTTNLYVTEQLAATSLFVSDNFTTNNINSLEGPLQIQSLAVTPLEIMAGKIVIDTNGDTKFLSNVEVAGNLTINNLVVAQNIDPTATESAEIIEGETNSNSVAGKTVLLANTELIKINNPKVTESSLIYVTPISSTQNKVLFVKSKGDGYFEIGFSEPLDSDVEFNWWIIELKDITTDQTEQLGN